VVFGNAGDRFGHLRVSLLAAVLYGVSAVAMVYLDPHRLWLYGAVFGIAHGVLYPTLNALILASMSPSRRGRAMAFYNGAFNVGSASSALGWGYLAQSVGYPSVFWGAALVSVCAVLTLAHAHARAPRTA
jgi:MFS family permease